MRFNDLIPLCSQNFSSRSAAIVAGGHNAEVIRYPRAIQARYIDPSEPLPLLAPYSCIRVQQLPNDFWAWLPDDPDDLKTLYEYKHGRRQFGDTRLIQSEITVADRGDANAEKARLEPYAINALLRKFQDEIFKIGKTYRTKVIMEEGRSQNPFIRRFVYTMLIAEEVR